MQPRIKSSRSGDQGDFVLDELAGVHTMVRSGRIELKVKGSSLGHVVVDVAVARPAGDLLAIAQRKAVLEVDVEGLDLFSE